MSVRIPEQLAQLYQDEYNVGRQAYKKNKK